MSSIMRTALEKSISENLRIMDKIEKNEPLSDDEKFKTKVVFIDAIRRTDETLKKVPY